MIKVSTRCANPHCPLQRSTWRTYLKPPRGVFLHKQWLCSPECLDQVLEQSLVPVIETTRANRETKSHRFPLGLVMHSLGLVTKESLQTALQAQREAGQGRVGDWLRRQGAVTEPQITQALAVQWSLPVYPLERWERLLNWLICFPSDCYTHFKCCLSTTCPPADCFTWPFPGGLITLRCMRSSRCSTSAPNPVLPRNRKSKRRSTSCTGGVLRKRIRS